MEYCLKMCMVLVLELNSLVSFLLKLLLRGQFSNTRTTAMSATWSKHSTSSWERILSRTSVRAKEGYCQNPIPERKCKALKLRQKLWFLIGGNKLSIKLALMRITSSWSLEASVTFAKGFWRPENWPLRCDLKLFWRTGWEQEN